MKILGIAVIVVVLFGCTINQTFTIMAPPSIRTKETSKIEHKQTAVREKTAEQKVGDACDLCEQNIDRVVDLSKGDQAE